MFHTTKGHRAFVELGFALIVSFAAWLHIRKYALPVTYYSNYVRVHIDSFSVAKNSFSFNKQAQTSEVCLYMYTK
jgi:hypothetical protein